jgi:hypothetical protein
MRRAARAPALAAAALDAATGAIRRDPSVTHCGRADCERRNDAVRGGPLPDGTPAG